MTTSCREPRELLPRDAAVHPDPGHHSFDINQLLYQSTFSPCDDRASKKCLAFFGMRRSTYIRTRLPRIRFASHPTNVGLVGPAQTTLKKTVMPSARQCYVSSVEASKTVTIAGAISAYIPTYFRASVFRACAVFCWLHLAAHHLDIAIPRLPKLVGPLSRIWMRAQARHPSLEARACLKTWTPCKNLLH